MRHLSSLVTLSLLAGAVAACPPPPPTTMTPQKPTASAPATAAPAAEVNPLLAPWTGPHGGVPPFEETREYVRRVNILHRRYRQAGS